MAEFLTSCPQLTDELTSYSVHNCSFLFYDVCDAVAAFVFFEMPLVVDTKWNRSMNATFKYQNTLHLVIILS